MIEKKYSITTSNFKKIIDNSKIEIEEDIITTFRSIYDEKDLRPYINDKEAIDIRKFSEFLLNSDLYFSAIKKYKSSQLEKKAVPLKSNYIFTSSSLSPKYHKNSDCKAILNNFENFEIPEEIRKRGEDEISRFREFAKENRGLLKAGNESYFIRKLQEKFNLNSNINKISFDNSGKVEVSKIPTINIKQKISDLLSQIDSINKSPEGQESIRKYMFTPSKMIKAMKNNENLSLLDLSVIEIKKTLLDLVIEFNIQKNNGLSVSENILEFFGFEKCGLCFADEANYHI